MTVQLDIGVELKGSYGGASALASVAANMALRTALGFTPGVGAGQANKMFAATRQIAASGNDDIDLAGSLVDPLGAAVTFARLKAIYVKAAVANVNDLLIGPSAANGFLGPWNDAADKTKLRPGEVFLITNRSAAGWAVTASTADLLRVTNGAGGSAVDYDIVLIGASS